MNRCIHPTLPYIGSSDAYVTSSSVNSFIWCFILRLGIHPAQLKKWIVGSFDGACKLGVFLQYTTSSDACTDNASSMSSVHPTVSFCCFFCVITCHHSGFLLCLIRGMLTLILVSSMGPIKPTKTYSTTMVRPISYVAMNHQIILQQMAGRPCSQHPS
jgi:hypothetical protein